MSQNAHVQPLRSADSELALRHVFIRNLLLEAQIGVHGHEHGRRQPVRINIDLAVDDGARFEDRLDQVVDYAVVADRVRAIVADGHIKLAETLAERIAAACLRDDRVKRARVRVEKLHALDGAESAGVEIERRQA